MKPNYNQLMKARKVYLAKKDLKEKGFKVNNMILDKDNRTIRFEIIYERILYPK